jgi:RNA polymerase sigma factor (sigma-70 family)
MVPGEVAELYAEHQRAARRLALTLVPPDAADDLVHEAFTKVLAAMGRGRTPAAFRPYLLAVVRNTARDWHTGRRRLVLVPAPEPAPAPSPEHDVIRAEDVTLARRAFDQLPERWRWVLWQTAVNERPVSELAAQTGLAPNTISQLASRAREGLRQAWLSEHAADASADPACQLVAPYLGAAVRGRAGQRHQAQLRAHLARCPRCRSAKAELAALNSHLGELLVPGAVGLGVLSKVLPVARAAVRPAARAHWHAAVAAASVSAMAGLSLVYVTGTVPAGQPPAQVSVPSARHARPASGLPSAPVVARLVHVPKHARVAAAAASASMVPATPPPSSPVSQVASVVPTVTKSVTQVVANATQAAGLSVPGAAGDVSGAVGDLGQLLNSAGNPVTPPSDPVTGTTGRLRSWLLAHAPS